MFDYSGGTLEGVFLAGSGKTSALNRFGILSLKLLLRIVFLLFVGSIGAAYADELTADQVSVTTPIYRPEFSDFEPALGTYTYVVSWQGIPAATASLSVAQDDMYYHLTSTARTYSGIDIFYKLRYFAEGTISSFDLTPVKTVIDQRENSKIKNTEITFHEDGETEVVRTSNKPETNTLKFKPNNFMLDPFAAAFLARSLRWEVGQSRQFDTFNGKSRYLITLTCSEKTTMKVNDEEREVWVITPSVKNLTSTKKSSKLRSAQIYITADKARELLQILSKVFIGSVTTELVSFKPLDTQAPLTRIARSDPARIVR